MHYMNDSTYDLDDFIFTNKQGIYLFKSNTQLINGPGGSITGPCTLQQLFNSADPVDNDIFAQQILRHNRNTYTRTCYWVQTSSTMYQTEWGEWQQSNAADYYVSGSWRIFKFGPKFAMACMSTATNHTPTTTQHEFVTNLPYISGYYPETYSLQASWAGITASDLLYNSMTINNTTYYYIDSYISGAPTNTSRILIRNVVVFYRQAT